jgi:ribonucleoside-diphosphate reductase alpha chain
MRDVVWEKGPVRCGHLLREDGVQVPMYHDSEVAAIAFMLQQILIRRGFLDEQANQAPVPQLARAFAARSVQPQAVATVQVLPTPPEPQQSADTLPAPLGAKCPECGARALRKVDGCSRCESCHYVGECG